MAVDLLPAADLLPLACCRYKNVCSCEGDWCTDDWAGGDSYEPEKT
ncbi:MAG: hypothetical protein QME49_01345 [bacterium]|nr:hypothetical protein [bacterium]